MKTVIIHGQSYEGSTCHIARMLAEKLGSEVTELFLPRDFGETRAGWGRTGRGCNFGASYRPILHLTGRSLEKTGNIQYSYPINYKRGAETWNLHFCCCCLLWRPL